MNKRIDVIIVGFGNVGRALFQELTRYKEFHVAGLVSSKGAVLLRNREFSGSSKSCRKRLQVR